MNLFSTWFLYCYDDWNVCFFLYSLSEHTAECLFVSALIHVILILPLEITTVMYTCIWTLITSASSTTTPASSKQVIVVSVSEPH